MRWQLISVSIFGFCVFVLLIILDIFVTVFVSVFTDTFVFVNRLCLNPFLWISVFVAINLNYTAVQAIRLCFCSGLAVSVQKVPKIVNGF